MNPEVLQLLGFDRTTQLIQGFAQTEGGRQYLAEIGPTTDPEELSRRLDQLQEGCRLLAEEGPIPLSGAGDPAALLAQLDSPTSILEPAELLEARAFLVLARRIRKQLAEGTWPLLAQRWSPLDDPGPLAARIDSVLDPSGEVRDGADPDLARVRQRGKRAKKKVEERLDQMLKSRAARFLIAEPFVTQRNDRFVVPVQVEHQKEIPGLVHGTSASGATVFLEPLSAVELNNEWIYCREREKEIIRQLLARLTSQLRSQLGPLRRLTRALAEFDALQARAGFGESFGCVVPGVRPGGPIRLEQARHPLLVEKLGDRVVPLTLQLGGDSQRALIISGPNAGGKTVVLKTLGLLSLMAQSGFPVPAREAEFPLFRQILADIGDRQSIAENLSTFSAHVLEVREMIANLEPPSLVLLDELGTGTDPTYGAALGMAILDHFQREEVLLLATTHHLAIKQYAEATPGAANACVGLDPQTLRPTYQLHFGASGQSSALEIALQLGLPEEIVQSARQRLDRNELEVEAFLSRLRQEQLELEAARQRTEQERRQWEDRQRILQEEARQREGERQREAQASLDRWQKEFRQQTERFLKKTRDRSEAARLRSQAKARSEALREKFRREMAETARSRNPAAPPSEAASERLERGDQVYDSFFQKRGELIAIEGQTALVEIDGKRVSTPLERLRKLERREVVQQPSPQVQWSVVEDTDPELNLIGLRVPEALDRTDKYLDRAFVSRLERVRLIHGFGTGRLERALSEFLKGHPHVSSFQVEGGATVVDLQH